MPAHERLLLLTQLLVQTFQSIVIELRCLCVAQCALRLFWCDHSVRWYLSNLARLWQQGPPVLLLTGTRLSVVIGVRQLGLVGISGFPPGLHHLVQPKGQTLSEHVLLVRKLAAQFQTRATETLEHLLDLGLGMCLEGLW